MANFTITTVKKTAPKTKAQTKAKLKAAPKVGDDTIAEAKALVDTICENHPAILAAKEPKKEQEKARKELLDIVEGDYDASEEISVTGTKGQVKFGARSTERFVKDVQALHQMLGDEAFYAICNPKLGEVDKYLTDAQKKKVIVSGQTGSRTMTVLPLNS